MTRYKLPPVLGGHEVEHVTYQPGLRNHIPVLLPGGSIITVDRVYLAPVGPPEPPNNSTVIIKQLGGTEPKLYAFTRIDGEYERMYGGDSKFRWYWHDNGEWITWDSVCEHGEPVTLAPGISTSERPYGHYNSYAVEYSPSILMLRLAQIQGETVATYNVQTPVSVGVFLAAIDEHLATRETTP